jgi:hypothetical protein
MPPHVSSPVTWPSTVNHHVVPLGIEGEVEGPLLGLGAGHQAVGYRQRHLHAEQLPAGTDLDRHLPFDRLRVLDRQLRRQGADGGCERPQVQAVAFGRREPAVASVIGPGRPVDQGGEAAVDRDVLGGVPAPLTLALESLAAVLDALEGLRPAGGNRLGGKPEVRSLGVVEPGQLADLVADPVRAAEGRHEEAVALAQVGVERLVRCGCGIGCGGRRRRRRRLSGRGRFLGGIARRAGTWSRGATPREREDDRQAENCEPRHDIHPFPSVGRAAATAARSKVNVGEGRGQVPKPPKRGEHIAPTHARLWKVPIGTGTPSPPGRCYAAEWRRGRVMRSRSSALQGCVAVITVIALAGCNSVGPGATASAPADQRPHEAPLLEAMLPAEVGGRPLATWSVTGETWINFTRDEETRDSLQRAVRELDIDLDKITYAVAGRLDVDSDPPYLIHAVWKPPDTDEIDFVLVLLIGAVGFVDLASADLAGFDERVIHARTVTVGTESMLIQDQHQRGKPYWYETRDHIFVIVTDDEAWAEEAIGKLGA